MSNMSYYRFQNTLVYLEYCAEAMREYHKNPDSISSDEELNAMQKLIQLCREIADEYNGGE